MALSRGPILSSPGVRLEVKPDKASDAYVMVRRIELESATDSFANSGVRDATGLSGDNVGTQIEGRYRRWLIQDSVRLTLGAAYIARGEFLEDAPNTTGEDDPLFGYTELQLDVLSAPVIMSSVWRSACGGAGFSRAATA